MAAIADRHRDFGLVGADDGVGDGFGGGWVDDGGRVSGGLGAQAGGSNLVVGIAGEYDGHIRGMTSVSGTREAGDEALNLLR